MIFRNFGTTGFNVSAIGYGAGTIGDHQIPEKVAETMLNTVLDAGINLIDTARGYGISEERIGKYISQRRNEFVLSTKVGYGIDGIPDWTYDCIIKGIEAALQRLQTDYIDIVHLHSCPIEILQKGEVIDALEKVRSDGKVRILAYSGENDALKYAVQTQRFQSVMASLNICDQRVIDHPLPAAKNQGMGFIAKRPVANAPWRFTQQPNGHYCEAYWLRWKKMGLQFDIGWQELALRFSAFRFGNDSCIVGTMNIDHLKENIAIVEKGKLPEEIVFSCRNAFRQHDQQWIGQI
ncbi:MAG: aldo/keto reductase [Calditrichaeota bacterium]|nr:aldo/keto reductase [Calditrichota bacterium]MCB0267997.1 aldo/keto reductase [Calditrichota bacterium]